MVLDAKPSFYFGRNLSGCVMKELQEPEQGVGGGLLLLAACTDGPLLLAEQAIKSMSQPAECAVN